MDSGAILFDGAKPLDMEMILSPQNSSAGAESPITHSEVAELRWLGHQEIVGRRARFSKKRPLKLGAAKLRAAFAEAAGYPVAAIEKRIFKIQVRSALAPADPQLPLIAAPIQKSGDRLLPVVGDFVPSAELAELWRESLTSLERDANVTHRFFVGATVPSSVLREEFKSTFEKSIASFANKTRYAGIQHIQLIQNLSFSPAVEFSLIDRLYLVPSKSAPVFEKLARELSNYLHKNGSIAAKWGELRPASDGVVIYFNPPVEVNSEKARVRAKLVK